MARSERDVRGYKTDRLSRGGFGETAHFNSGKKRGLKRGYRGGYTSLARTRLLGMGMPY